MKNLTNKFGYPIAFVEAVRNDPYSRGDSEYSATSLITPPRILALQEKHRNDIVVDVNDRVESLYGQVVHGILERAGRGLGRGVVEQRFFGVVDGVRISAQIDSLDLEDDGTLVDYKFTTVKYFKQGLRPKAEWIKQMNIQLELMRQNGLDATRMRIWGELRDWRYSERRDPGYPNKLAFYDIPIAPRERTVAFISRTIAAHKQAKVSLPQCSDEDRWFGARCHEFCEVSKFCSQYQQRRGL